MSGNFIWGSGRKPPPRAINDGRGKKDGDKVNKNTVLQNLIREISSVSFRAHNAIGSICLLVLFVPLVEKRRVTSIRLYELIEPMMLPVPINNRWATPSIKRRLIIL